MANIVLVIWIDLGFLNWGMIKRDLNLQINMTYLLTKGYCFIKLRVLQISPTNKNSRPEN